MTRMMLGDSILKALTPSVNAALKGVQRARICSYKGVQQGTNLIFVLKLRVTGLEFGPQFLSVCDVSKHFGRAFVESRCCVYMRSS
jgi:hypothetical protein